MRFGAKILFEDVTCSFHGGAPLRHQWAQWRRQVHSYEDIRGGHRAFERLGHAPEEARSPAAGPVRLRPISRDRHRNHGERSALEGSAGAGRPIRQTLRFADRRRRHAFGRARGDRWRRRRVHGGVRCRGAARRARRRSRCARAQNGRAARRPEGPRSAGAGSVWQPAGTACSTSRRTISISIPCIGCRTICAPTKAC